MANGIHTEETFEALIEAHLVEHGGYESGAPDTYDRDLALLTDTVLAFVQDTQPKVWAQLQAIHKDSLNASSSMRCARCSTSEGRLKCCATASSFTANKSTWPTSSLATTWSQAHS